MLNKNLMDLIEQIQLRINFNPKIRLAHAGDSGLLMDCWSYCESSCEGFCSGSCEGDCEGGCSDGCVAEGEGYCDWTR